MLRVWVFAPSLTFPDIEFSRSLGSRTGFTGPDNGVAYIDLSMKRKRGRKKYENDIITSVPTGTRKDGLEKKDQYGNCGYVDYAKRTCEILRKHAIQRVVEATLAK